MEKMTVKEVIDKLANTKIYTRGEGDRNNRENISLHPRTKMPTKRIRSVPVLRVN